MAHTLPSARCRGAAVAAVVLGALTLGACGGSDGSVPGTGTSSAAAGDGDAARVRLQQCLRDQGLDVPEPGAGGGAGAAGRLSAADREKLQEALEGPCETYRDGAFGDVSEEDRQELQDAFQEFAACMRENGVELPDRQPGAGGPPAGGAGIDEDDPEVQAATERCRDKLPQNGPGGNEQ